MITDLKELLDELNKPPLPEEIKANDDGSLYIPISIVQHKLDRIFGIWNWDFDRDEFGKNSAKGKGTLSVKYPNDFLCIKSGTAGIKIAGNMQLDYPSLESRAMMNAAKKFGRTFGRDLNRDREDAPLPTTQLRDTESSDNGIDESYKATLDLVNDAATKEEALSIIGKSEWKYHTELKAIANSKP